MFQKFFASLLTYAIGLQLMVGAIPNTPVSWVAYGQSCGSGLQWNSTLNRCLTTEEAAKVQEANAECMKKETVDAQRACLNASLVARVQDAESKGEISGHKGQSAATIQIMIAFAAVAAGGLFLLTGGGDCPGATSAWLMIGGGAAVIAGELMSSMTYKKEMKKAEEKLAKAGEGSANSDGSSDNSTATNVQADAFEAMIQKEQATIKAGKTKKNLYMVSLAAYGAAAALAAWEVFRYYNPYDPSAKVELTCPTAYAPTPVGASTSTKTDQMYAAREASSPAATYVDNYFLNKQRVPFTHYVSHNLAITTTDFDSFIAVNTELERLRKGHTTSMNAIEYEVLMAGAAEANRNFDHSMFNEIRDIYVEVKNQVLIPKAHAAVTGLFTLMSEAWKSTTLSAGDKFKKLYSNPMTRLIFAGILTTNSMIMMNNASKEIKKAEERKSFMEKLRTQVMASGSAFGCSTADRNSNLSKPQCYCYQEGGTLNPARSKSATCKQYFGDKPQLASNTLNSTDVSNEKSCITSTGGFDSSCSCRKSNTCVTVKTPKVIGNTPSASVLGNLPATLNGLNSGALSAADVDTNNMGSLAARLNGIKDKLLADPKNKKFADMVKKEQEKVNKLVDGIRRDLAAAPPIASSSPTNSSFMGATNPSEALEKMKADLKQEIKGYEGGVVNMNNGAAAAKKDEFSLDGLNAGGVTIADEGLENQAKLDEIMAAQYEMGDSEINSDPGANIFQILTNRYQRSGMRRLFGAEKVVPADKPVEAPIAQ